MGESFTHTLALTLQDTDSNDVVNSGDVTIVAGASTLAKSAFSIPGGVASLTLTALGDMASGDPVSLLYSGDKVFTVGEPMVPGPVLSGEARSVTLTNARVVGGLAGITIISGNVTATGYTTGTGIAVFTATQNLTTGDTFTIRYTGTEEFAVPGTGLFYNPATGATGDGETFALSLNLDKLPLQDTDGDSAITTADISVTVAKRTPARRL